MKSKHAFALSLFLTLLIASNLYFFKSIGDSQKDTVFVVRVIDGDTLELDDGKIIRLLNINTPEKNEQGYGLAKEFLRKIENTSVEIIQTGTDKYDRTLAKVYTEEYLNLQIIKEGLAKKFLVQDNELREFSKAEKESIEQEKGIWKKSSFYSCISSEINAKEEYIILKNSCKDINFKDFILTDESRKKYKFTSLKFDIITLFTKEGKDNENALYWGLEEHVWNDDRDTLYLFDKEGNIVHYDIYGY